MSKIFICRECGYAFPGELSHLIEQNIQVYCERCGSPFNLEGVKFKPASTPVRKKIKRFTILSEQDSSTLEKLIQFLNAISFLPLFIFASISFGLIAEIALSWDNWIDILVSRSLLGSISLFLLIYDRAYIYPKIKEKKYDEIFIHSLCWGIVGSILFGLGVIILIKGVLIVFYIISNPKNKELRAYDYGLLIKDSLNNFSAKIGFLIILLGIYGVYSGKLYSDVFGGMMNIPEFPFLMEIPSILLIYAGFLVISIAALLIDLRLKSRIGKQQRFKMRDSISLFILGVFSSIFFAAGIFILLKGILIFFLVLGKPAEQTHIKPIEERQEWHPSIYRDPKRSPKIIPIEKEKEVEKVVEPTISQPSLIAAPIEEESKELEKITPKIEKLDKEKREKEFKLKLHESLLPVKDEKDKKLVHEYFSKIFAVLSKDLRKQIIDLKISKKEKRELLQELVFLTKQEQVKYIETLVSLYKEIPKKLIGKIRRLPNVKPKHYDKIVEQLKYMDYEEQMQYVQFLKENA